MEFSPESQGSKVPILETEIMHADPSHEKKENMISEIVRFSLVALIIVLPIRLFIAQPFIVSGESMETTFSTGQYLIVDQLSYHFEEPQRGDVIVFRYPKDPSKFFIKRVIGVPGDTVEVIAGQQVKITNTTHPEGVTLDEYYIQDMKPGASVTEKLGENEFFVMGDNRNKSSDSRAWGVLQRDKIIGRAFLRLFPFTNVGVLPGQIDISKEMAL